MRIVFAGTPEFAAVALAALHRAGHEIVLVLTQPDRSAGRGMKLRPSPVKQFALAHGIEVFQPATLRPEHRTRGNEGAAAQAKLRSVFAGDHAADLMVVAAYGLILPQAVLDMPALGCVNIHASLLPRWRGAAPIHRAIEAGDVRTGITIMRMDAGLDTGPMLLARTVPIAADDTTASLHDTLAALGGSLIVEALARFDTLEAQPQPASGVTYAQKVDKHEAALDFRLPASVLANRVRAFNPAPGAMAVLMENSSAGTRAGDGGAPVPLKFWRARVVDCAGEPGQVLAADAHGVVIAAGDGRAICVTELQKPGGKRLGAREFLAGCPIAAGVHVTPAG